jgi:hypothetical protein
MEPDVMTCVKEINTEDGSNNANTVENSNPSNNHVGVPKTRIPMPNIDWTIAKIATIKK